MRNSLNIIIFGEGGVGKSSVINLIAGKKVAETFPNPRGCTLESKRYTFQVAERTFNIWDTIGLQEPVFGVADFLGAIEKTYSLIQQITAEGGLDLLLFCIYGIDSRVPQTGQCNYRLFFEVLCGRKVPIALVVTHLEAETRMEDWWVRSADYLNRCGLKFSGHACVTGLHGHMKEEEGRQSLIRLLLSYDHEGRYNMPPTSGEPFGFLEKLSSISRPKTTKDTCSQLERLLRDRCMMSRAVAQQLAKSLTRVAPDNARQLARTTAYPARQALHAKGAQYEGDFGVPSSFNIVLFGEAGVGKSSVVNLIADKDIAKTSGDSWGCTLESEQYTFSVAGKTFSIWDTVGLGEPSFSATNYLGAIEKTYGLIQQIQDVGGLDLLLFCIPGNGSRITQTMLCNYRLFFEVFCEKRIPISVVVTRLEGEANMDEWWNRNEEHISRSGLKFGGHACITGQREHPNAAQGRAALELLLLGYDHKGRYPMPPASAWFAGFLERLPVIPRSKEVKNKRKEVERPLPKIINRDEKDNNSKQRNPLIRASVWSRVGNSFLSSDASGAAAQRLRGTTLLTLPMVI